MKIIYVKYKIRRVPLNIDQITLEELNDKTLTQIKDIAKEIGIKSISKYKKGELIELIIENSNSKQKNDLEKNSKCKKDGIKLYRLREELLPLNDSSIDYVVQKGQKDLPEILEEVLSEIIGMSVEVDFERDNIDIENGIYPTIRK